MPRSTSTNLARGGGEVSENVPSAGLPGRGADRIVNVLGKPQAETVVVLVGEDDAVEAVEFGEVYLVSGAKVSRVEEGRVYVAGTPLLSGEGVETEVEEEEHVTQLPLDLEDLWEGQYGK
ncbi:hypothetical protein S83_017361 [Arachis hypogaea]